MKEQTDYILRFRKRVMYAFAVMGLSGNLVNLAGGFFSANLSASQITTRWTSNLFLGLMWVVLLLLTARNKVQLAGLVFCSFSLVTVTVSLLNIGLDSMVPVLYILVVVVSAAFLTPLTTALFGLLAALLNVAASSWLVSQSAVVVPADKGANIAIVTLVLLGITGLLFGFSRGLGNLVRSTRQQAVELAQLNATLQRQRQVEANIGGQISDLTDVLSIIFREQHYSSQEQAAMVSDVASTTRELDAAARKIADNAMSVATVAEKAQKSVEVGQQAAYLGINSIGQLRQRVQEINTSMRTLNQQLERISEVTEIIGEIADETNLLALNATIEAAGAREYGRRFAAVADEVQRLSRRATTAVEQIQEMVVEINQASDKALNATEQGLREAQVSDKLVVSLTVANDDVTHLVAQTSDLAANIAGATQQQREASAQIVEIMQKIIVSANRLATSSSEVNRVVTSLEDATDRLNQATEPDQSASVLRSLPLAQSTSLALAEPTEPELAVKLGTR